MTRFIQVVRGRGQLIVRAVLLAMVLGAALGATVADDAAARAYPQVRAKAYPEMALARVRGNVFLGREDVEVAAYDDATGEMVDVVQVRTTRSGNFATWLEQPCYAGLDIYVYEYASDSTTYKHLRAPGCDL